MDDRNECRESLGNPFKQRDMIYIYIYMCVCVCVCRCGGGDERDHNSLKMAHHSVNLIELIH